MSTQIFPLAVWQSGTNENSIPANDNALRVQVLMGPAVGVADSEPASPAEDDQYIIGTSWGGFTATNVVICKGGNFLEFESFTGWVKVIGSVQNYFNGASWVAGGGGGGGGQVDSVVAGDGISVNSTDPANPIVSSPLVTVGAVTPSAGVATLDFQGGRRKHFTLSLSENTTLAGSNFAPSGTATEFEVRITNTGSFSLTIPTWLKPLGGSDTTVAQGSGAITRLAGVTYDAGTSGDYAMQDRIP